MKINKNKIIKVLALIFTFTLMNTSVYAKTNDYSTKIVNGGVEITGYSGKETYLEIPSTLDGLKVISIGNSSFNNKKLREITLPNTIEHIGNRAFSSNNLTKLTLPNSLKTIGADAFILNDIKTLNLNEGLIDIGREAFASNKIEALSIPNSIENIGIESFRNNKIRTLKLPNAIKVINKGVFESNEIFNLKLPESLEVVGASAFKKNKITEVTLPKGVTEVKEDAFAQNNIQTLNLNNGLKTIDTDAFYSNNISKLVIPDTVENIGTGSFRWNPIKSLKLSNNIKVIPTEAFFRHELTQLEIPKNVKTIGKYAFASGVKLYEPNTLKNVVLNEGLEEINDKAFENLDVKNLTLPKSIKFIHMYAFGYNFKDTKTILNGYKNTYSEEYALEQKLDFYPLDGFKDLSTKNSFYAYVYDLFNQGIIKGYEENNTFRPNNQLTRAQAAKMIVLAANIDIKGASSNFKDVKKPTKPKEDGSYSSYDYISAAYRSGIISGYDDGTFKPNANVTRAQIAKMTTIAFNLKVLGNPPKVKDVEKITNPKTRNYIYTLMSHEIVKGYDDGFRPYNNVTRGQFSKIAIIAQESGR